MWLKGLLSLFFSEKCPICKSFLKGPGSEPGEICPACRGDIAWIQPPWCPRCGRPYSPGNSSHLCAACAKGENIFDWGRSLALYQGMWAQALHRFKYRGEVGLADPLGRMAAGVDFGGQNFEAVIPVPLHVSRLRERGFNQALLIGEGLGKKHKVKVLRRAIQRVRNTPPQVSLGPSDRKRNVRKAFAVVQPEKIRGKNLLLVDDVFTTGSTVNECARILKKAGAEKVLVLTLARTG